MKKNTRIKLAEVLDDVLALARIADEQAHIDLSYLKKRQFYNITMSQVLSHYRLFKASHPSVTKQILKEDYYIWETIVSRKKHNHRKAIVPRSVKAILEEQGFLKEGRLFPLNFSDYINFSRRYREKRTK